MKLADIDVEPERLAARAGLEYVDEREAGIRRRRRGSGFSFVTADGEVLSGDERARCLQLAVPPAWDEVWICPDPDGHLQAVGRDEAGRLQYRYHDDFRAAAEAVKYDRMLPFGNALERIRRTVDADLDAPEPRRRSVAAALRLIDRALLRVGSDEPEDPDDAVGATTLAIDHVAVDGATIELDFVGKGGREHHRRLEDERLADVLGDLRRLGAEHLLVFDDGDDLRRVTDQMVNDRLRDITGQAFTAKDFRTWGGTATFTAALATNGGDEVAAVDAAAERLGNTRAVARASYCSPVIAEAAADGTLADTWARTRTGAWLDRAERVTRRVLEAAGPCAGRLALAS